MAPLYKRILLKLSGESLMGEQQYGIDANALRAFAEDVKEARDLGVEMGIVFGGGNIYRGMQAESMGIDKVSGDHMGMLATVINCLAFQNALESLGVPTRLQTAIRMDQIAEAFIRRRAMRHLEKGRVVVFGAGTGNPYFTTDTAAVLRAVEIEADVVIKGTRVDGIYDKDPEKHTDAKRFKEISYKETLDRDLRVMDMTAITMARENKKPILVFNMNERGNLRRLLLGEPVATIVKE
ncbi:MAG: UMP kinase [Ignavibacteria bacterium]|jgi:uridylate kinase|nr:UMP kinase [Ignavibacteria bacterium]MBK6420438.1 UMP kinase [Ignavibacteria bacterium]MBK6761601.1 UMP kinase [Ignavibacteria bacterium]MBK7033633.1 UMP kinase [Ignavibacteria bacterium]MBK7412612.1 UMP kinase [Ignavibacteria bacterium]